jgi:uncharacterized membrane protein YqjE
MIDLRAMQTLQRAAPVLLRHVASYLELAKHDVTVTSATLLRRLTMLLIIIVSGLLSLCLACVLVIAAMWNSPYRLLTIGLLVAGFAIIGITLSIYLITRPRLQPFIVVRREWKVDRALINRWLLSERS